MSELLVRFAQTQERKRGKVNVVTSGSSSTQAIYESTSPSKKKKMSTVMNIVFNVLQYYLFSDVFNRRNWGTFWKIWTQKKSLAKIKEKKRFPGISLPFLYTFFEAAF